MKDIEKIVQQNPTIRVWNLSLGSMREADDAGEEPAPQAPVQEPVKKERNWRSIFKRTLDKINEGFNAADDEEI
jgi:hypothetical protein